MPSRLQFLTDAFEGLKSTGVPLVAVRDGQVVPAVERDDIGLSYVIPEIAKHLNLSVPQAINAFYYSLIGLCFLIGAAGILVLFKRLHERLLALAGAIIIAFLCTRVGDVYVFAPSLTIAFLPWIIYSLEQQERPLLLILTFLITGFVGAFCHFLRAHCATGVVLFGLLGLAVVCSVSARTKMFAVLALCGAMVLPFGFFKVLTLQRDRYIREHNPSYQFAINRHPFWHSVYIGLGFVYNQYVPAYRDEVGEAKVKSIDPSLKYVSAGYEDVLKKEVLKIHSPTFWINNFGAKLGVIAMYLLIFGNFGVCLRMFSRKAFELDLPFAAGLAFTALPGILVVPYREYLLGFIAFAVLYNVAYVNYYFSAVTGRPASRAVDAEPARTVEYGKVSSPS